MLLLPAVQAMNMSGTLLVSIYLSYDLHRRYQKQTETVMGP
jgi:hypothetical protein